MLVGGDFNTHSVDWFVGATELHVHDDAKASGLKSWMVANGLSVHNDPCLATRTQIHRRVDDMSTIQSAPDLTLSRGISVSNWTTAMTSMSDHRILTYKVNASEDVLFVPADNTEAHRATVISWKKAKWDPWRSAVAEKMTTAMSESLSVNRRLKCFVGAIQAASRKHVPKGAWPLKTTVWNAEVEEAFQAALAARAIRDVTPTEETVAAYDEARVAYRELLRTTVYEHQKSELLKLDPGKAAPWSLVKAKLTPPKQRLRSALAINGTESSDPLKQADAFNAYYARHSQNATKRVRGIRIRKRSAFRPITEEELRAAISKLSNGKAPGEDDIHAEELKQLPDCAFEALLSILNASLWSGEVPQLLRDAIIVPIPKPGKDETAISSFRPIQGHGAHPDHPPLAWLEPAR